MKLYDFTGANSHRITQAMQQASRPSAARSLWNWIMAAGPRMICRNLRKTHGKRRRRIRSYTYCE